VNCPVATDQPKHQIPREACKCRRSAELGKCCDEEGKRKSLQWKRDLCKFLLTPPVVINKWVMSSGLVSSLVGDDL